MRIFNKIQHYVDKHIPLGREVFVFLLVGATNAVLDFSIYIGLTRTFDFWQTNYLGANIVAFIIATTSSFFLNKHYTFRNKSKNIAKQYLKFWTVALIYIALVQSILYIGVVEFKLYDILAKVIAMGIGTFWNFTAHKYWSFRTEKGMINPE
ncbi:MAG: GtrA family protein [Patescibacteria group bacterium]